MVSSDSIQALVERCREAAKAARLGAAHGTIISPEIYASLVAPLTDAADALSSLAEPAGDCVSKNGADETQADLRITTDTQSEQAGMPGREEIEDILIDKLDVFHGGIEGRGDAATAILNLIAPAFAAKEGEIERACSNHAYATVGWERERGRTEQAVRELERALSSEELKLVDKHCDWLAFQHAFNAVMKHRAAAIRAQGE